MIDAETHPQETMAEVARVVRDWSHGPMLSETALSEIRALVTAYEATRSAEPVAWVSRQHIKFLDEGRKADRPSSATVHDRPNKEMGWNIPLYAHPTPEAPDV